MSDKEAVPEWDDLMKRRGWLFIPDCMMQTFWQGIQANPNWQIVIDAIERLPHKDGCDISGCSWLFEPLSDKEGAPEYLVEITEDDNGKVIAVRAERFTLSPLKEKIDESILLDTIQTGIGTLEVYAGAMPKTPDTPKKPRFNVPPLTKDDFMKAIADDGWQKGTLSVHNGSTPEAPADLSGGESDRQDDEWSRAAKFAQIADLAKQIGEGQGGLYGLLSDAGWLGVDLADKIEADLPAIKAAMDEATKPDPKTEAFAEALAAANRKVGC